MLRISWVVILLNLICPIYAQEHTKAITLLMDDNQQCSGFTHSLSGSVWVSKKHPLYEISAPATVMPQLSIEAIPGGRILLCLTLVNTGKDTVTVEPVFPSIQHLKPADGHSEDLFYLFPAQGSMVDNKDDVVLTESYGGNFPMQFIDVYQKDVGGIYVICRDTTAYPKSFSLSKQSGSVSLKIRYRSRLMAPGESWMLPPIELGAHLGDWHEGLTAYRHWLKEWLKPINTRKQWFQDVYNFRQVFLHLIFGDDGAFDPGTKKIRLIEKVNDDKEAFGGVDYVHIFDWSQTPEHGRVGDYSPWEYLGGTKALKQQIRKLRRSGIKVGLYQEGYLISKKSKIGQEKGIEWQQLDTNRNPYERFGSSYYYPCALVEDWKNYLTESVRKASKTLGTDGAYIDQFGFGWQYGCYNEAHDHDTRKTSIPAELQIQGEKEIMAHLKNKLPKDKVTYTEEMPVDAATAYQDGSFTYAVSTSRNPSKNNPSRINIARFAFPDFKLFEILHVDEPIGNDTMGIKHVFFNGEGLWIAGPLNDPNWFPENVRILIRKTHSILREYKDAFRSSDPVPLVPISVDSIYVNLFPTKHKNVWTIYNAKNQSYSGEILTVPHFKGAVYYDAWHGKYLIPEIANGNAIIRLEIKGQDIGCVVQTF